MRLKKTVRVEFAPNARGKLLVLVDVPECFRREGYDIAIVHEELDAVFYFCAIGLRNWAIRDAPLTTGSYVVEEGNAEQVYVLYALFPEQTFVTEAEIGAFLDGALYAQSFQQKKEIQFYTRQLEALQQRSSGYHDAEQDLGELPNNARFYRVGDEQEYEKIALTQVSERFPAWPESLLSDRSLTNYRIPDATQPDHYFPALMDQTIVCIEGEDEPVGSSLSSC